ncbi:MAG: hypothetical protein HRT57_04215, partial [Crocinitomicaceae bacterium]|nr:hypothetical protein [Crocinitomicaceae bacterium]
LPKKFNVVDTINELQVIKESPNVHEGDWDQFHKKIRHRIFYQKWLWGIFIEIVLTTLGFIIAWNSVKVPNLSDRADEVSVKVFNFLKPMIPDGLNGFLYKISIQYSFMGIVFVVGILIFIGFRINFRKQTQAWAERLRKLYISVPEGAPHPAFVSKEKTNKANSEKSN